VVRPVPPSRTGGQAHGAEHGRPRAGPEVDTEAHPNLAARYQVSSIPNFLVLKGGRVVSQQAGLVDATQMMRWLESA